MEMDFKTYNAFVDEKVLLAIEQLWGYALPQPYRKSILGVNGVKSINLMFLFKETPKEGSCLVDLFGIYKDFNNNILLKSQYSGNRIPENMLPIGRDIYGNLVLLSIKGSDRGKVYFWDHEMEADPAQEEVPDYSNLTLIADSFDEFINSLKSIED